MMNVRTKPISDAYKVACTVSGIFFGVKNKGKAVSNHVSIRV